MYVFHNMNDNMDAADITSTDEKSPLAVACFSGNVEKVRELLSHGADIYPEEECKRQPIILAVQCKKESRNEIIKLLIEHGADVNYGGGLPLQTAIVNSDVEGVELLIAAGAQFNYNEHYPIMDAVCSNRTDDRYNYWDIHEIEEMKLDKVKKRMRILRILLESGLNMDYIEQGCCDDVTRYALHTVCADNRTERMPPEMLELLLYYGADVNKEEYGLTAFHLACRYLDIEKMKLLINHGADVNKPDHMGRTPIQICTKADRSHCLDNFPVDDIIRYLAEEKGANIHTVCPDSKLNLLGSVCVKYDESKLPIVLYYMSRSLPLQPITALYLIKLFGLAREEYESNDETHFMPDHGKQILSIFLIDNIVMLGRSHIQSCIQDINEKSKALESYIFENSTLKSNTNDFFDNTGAACDSSEGEKEVNQSTIQSCYAGRIPVDLFDRHLHGMKDSYMFYTWKDFSRKYCTLQPDFDLLHMLHGAGFVMSVPDDLEQELATSEETREMTLNILQEERSRVPSLAELCRWAVRRILGPGLISMGKVEGLPLPKSIIEYILLLDIIEKRHAETMYDYFLGKKSLKMTCVTKNKQIYTLSGVSSVYGKCAECQADTTEKLKKQKEREETRRWAREFLEQCQDEDSQKAQESFLHHPEEWTVLDEI